MVRQIRAIVNTFWNISSEIRANHLGGALLRWAARNDRDVGWSPKRVAAEESTLMLCDWFGASRRETQIVIRFEERGTLNTNRLSALNSQLQVET